MFGIRRTAMMGALVMAASLGFAAPAAAHCDSMDGPVVTAAREALRTGQVAGVLIWVKEEDEEEIRAAFERTLRVRAAGPEARELADLWFFETLVRIHRAGEGAPYTGLKPAGYEAPAGIEAADRALEAGSIDALADPMAGAVVEALRERYERAVSLQSHDPDDVAAGRRWVHAYVEYIHFVEAAHELLHHEGH